MSWLPHRVREPEIQDEPGLDQSLLFGALRGLRRINFWSRSYHALWRPIRELARETGAPQLSVLDIATGAGDIPIALWRRARRDGLRLDIQGCDLNPQSVGYAQKLAEKKKADVRFFTWDAVQTDFPRQYDVVTCSLFLHHLDDLSAVQLLQRMARTARRMIVVSDLRRSAPGAALAYLGTRVLGVCRVNRVDSVRSVQAAFTLEEAAGLAEEAGLRTASVTRTWPCRFVLISRAAEQDGMP